MGGDAAKKKPVAKKSSNTMQPASEDDEDEDDDMQDQDEDEDEDESD